MSGPIGELRGFIDIPDREIGSFSNFKCSPVPAQPQCPRSITGDSGERLFGREAKQCAGKGSVSKESKGPGTNPG